MIATEESDDGSEQWQFQSQLLFKFTHFQTHPVSEVPAVAEAAESHNAFHFFLKGR